MHIIKTSTVVERAPYPLYSFEKLKRNMKTDITDLFSSATGARVHEAALARVFMGTARTRRDRHIHWCQSTRSAENVGRCGTRGNVRVVQGAK